MSRPRKSTVDYFPHDTDAGSSKTMFTLQSRFGNDGYAFWFKLLELLGRTEGHVYDYNNPADWQFMLAITLVNEDTANNILQTLVDLGAIDKNLAKKKVIWCQNFVDNVADAYKRRQVALPLRPGNSTTPQETQPKASTIITYLEELRPGYPDLDLDAELVKFNLYWSEGNRKLKRPKSAFLNWLTKAREFKSNSDKKLPVQPPAPQPEEEHEILTDKAGNTYYLDNQGVEVY